MLSYYPYYSGEVQKGPGVYLSDAIVEIVKPDTGPDLGIQTLEFIQDISLMSVQIHMKLYIMSFFWETDMVQPLSGFGHKCLCIMTTYVL